MSGTTSHLTASGVRKQLLLVESDMNRLQLLEEWQTLGRESRELVQHARSACSVVTTVAAMGIAGIKAFRDSGPAGRQHKYSWLSTLISSLRLGASVWKAFRGQSH